MDEILNIITIILYVAPAVLYIYISKQLKKDNDRPALPPSQSNPINSLTGLIPGLGGKVARIALKGAPFNNVTNVSNVNENPKIRTMENNAGMPQNSQLPTSDNQINNNQINENPINDNHRDNTPPIGIFNIDTLNNSGKVKVVNSTVGIKRAIFKERVNGGAFFGRLTRNKSNQVIDLTNRSGRNNIYALPGNIMEVSPNESDNISTTDSNYTSTSTNTSIITIGNHRVELNPNEKIIYDEQGEPVAIGKDMPDGSVRVTRPIELITIPSKLSNISMREPKIDQPIENLLSATSFVTNDISNLHQNVSLNGAFSQNIAELDNAEGMSKEAKKAYMSLREGFMLLLANDAMENGYVSELNSVLQKEEIGNLIYKNLNNLKDYIKDLSNGYVGKRGLARETTYRGIKEISDAIRNAIERNNLAKTSGNSTESNEESSNESNINGAINMSYSSQNITKAEVDGIENNNDISTEKMEEIKASAQEYGKDSEKNIQNVLQEFYYALDKAIKKATQKDYWDGDRIQNGNTRDSSQGSLRNSARDRLQGMRNSFPQPASISAISEANVGGNTENNKSYTSMSGADSATSDNNSEPNLDFLKSLEESNNKEGSNSVSSFAQNQNIQSILNNKEAISVLNQEIGENETKTILDAIRTLNIGNQKVEDKDKEMLRNEMKNNKTKMKNIVGNKNFKTLSNILSENRNLEDISFKEYKEVIDSLYSNADIMKQAFGSDRRRKI